MSTETFTETQSVLSTFKPEPRKYDLRTAEGKYFKRLNSYSTEFTVDAGNITVNEEHGYGDDSRIVAVSYPAIHLVRTAEIDSALVETYLKHKLVRNWSCRDKGKASLTVINEALYQERWSGGWWVHVDAIKYTLTADGELTVLNATINTDEWKASTVIAKALGNTLFEITNEIKLWEQADAKDAEHEQHIADLKASFVPSYGYERALREATKVIERGVEPSEGENSHWHNHIHVAIDTEVLMLCKRFVQVLGSTTDKVRTAFPSYREEDTRVIDENIAYALVIAERTGGGWSSNDFSGAVLGQVIHKFTRIVTSL